MQRRTYLAAGGATIAVAALTATLLTGTNALSSSEDRTIDASGPIEVHGIDRLPSETAEEWVAYADHVVSVTATSATEVPATPEEIARGEGVIGRNVNLSVNNVLWSRTGVAQPAPTSWQYSAAGWQFKNGDLVNRREMAIHGQPRVEPGHTYIMAIAWQAAQCGEDGTTPAGWIGLGGGSEVAFEGGIIGNGENEGTVTPAQPVTGAAAKALPIVPPIQERPLKDFMKGKSSTALVTVLNSVTPGPVARKFTQQNTNCP
ncbi:hypothetical protein [Streptomyces yaizuensis]|uniref:Secreted protein n=1 Tax=Streptomyces yaizuensis TaxID=2989713 RepID=A0ABQ5P3K7_9ACTN|nr:hypothetical protein [Streptomyces sp. YSPA8]GLF97171.1 hypothetical protein SYYSPA8_22760 [Streptomyces sp. YSPA8]